MVELSILELAAVVLISIIGTLMAVLTFGIVSSMPKGKGVPKMRNPPLPPVK